MNISAIIDGWNLVPHITNIQKFSKYYLSETGWIKSVKEGASIDSDGKPVPWLTYPAIDFLKGKDFSRHDMLEYGAGNSTIWWAARVKSIVSVEHNVFHYRKVRDKKLSNATLLLRSEYKGIYENSPTFIDKKKYDIISIGAIRRMECLDVSFDLLCEDGVIIFDCSMREEYGQHHHLFKSRGFKSIDFMGPKPISPYKSCTAIFYRQDNVLGI